MTSSSYKRIFKDKEILSVEKFYIYSEKIKIKAFVPESHLENILFAMSKAGAGIIGNYEMCSFRTNGTGTYIPGTKAKPFLGNTNELSVENEFKFEMECGKNNLNKVLDALLKNHPYEEVAYEIYTFLKRENISGGLKLELNSPMNINNLKKRLNKFLKPSETEMDFEFKKIILTSIVADETFKKSAKFTECDCLLEISKNNYKLFKI